MPRPLILSLSSQASRCGDVCARQKLYKKFKRFAQLYSIYKLHKKKKARSAYFFADEATQNVLRVACKKSDAELITLPFSEFEKLVTDKLFQIRSIVDLELLIKRCVKRVEEVEDDVGISTVLSMGTDFISRCAPTVDFAAERILSSASRDKLLHRFVMKRVVSKLPAAVSYKWKQSVTDGHDLPADYPSFVERTMELSEKLSDLQRVVKLAQYMKCQQPTTDDEADRESEAEAASDGEAVSGEAASDNEAASEAASEEGDETPRASAEYFNNSSSSDEESEPSDTESEHERKERDRDDRPAKDSAPVTVSSAATFNGFFVSLAAIIRINYIHDILLYLYIKY